MLNKYFPNLTYGREQDLVEDLIIESIKIHGLNVRYVPRTIVRDDPLFGEDTISDFSAAVEIEMYLNDVDGFGGDGTILSKFGIEMRDTVTFTVARKRFDQAASEKLTTEVGYNILLETANTGVPSRQFLTTAYSGDSIQLETATSEGYSITKNRPMEGDLLYFPLVGKLFEIKYVEHETVFYQLGRLQTYDLKCELFEYSDENIATGNTVIDAIETSYSTDILNFNALLETGDNVLSEDGGQIVMEFRIEDIDPIANNEYFDSNVDSTMSDENVLDFSEDSPFGDWDRI